VAGDARALHGGLGIADLDVELPPGNDASYPAAVAALVRRHRLDLVIPVFAPELRALAPPSPGPPSAAAVLVSGRETIEICLSKRRLAAALAAVGVAVPAPLSRPTAADLPVFVRPDDATGGRRARRIEDREQLRLALRQEPDLVVTAASDDEEYSLDGYAWPAGHLRHAICRRRDEVKGGLVVRSTVVAGDAVRPLAARIAAALGLVGFFNFQFFASASGPVVFDVNPRLGGGMALSFAAGLDPLRCLGLVAGGEVVEAPWEERTGLVLLRRWQNLFREPGATGA
jgi:carbamoyl-phosphate synthase large subunit